MLNKLYKLVAMKVIIEHSDDNKSWLVMIKDMLGKRPYVSTKFDSPDSALNYITEEFRNCSEVNFEINSDLK